VDSLLDYRACLAGEGRCSWPGNRVMVVMMESVSAEYSLLEDAWGNRAHRKGHQCNLYRLSIRLRSRHLFK
jgi:hypothetical protein